MPARFIYAMSITTFDIKEIIHIAVLFYFSIVSATVVLGSLFASAFLKN